MSDILKMVGLAVALTGAYAVGKVVGACYGAGIVALQYRTDPELADKSTEAGLNFMATFFPTPFDRMAKRIGFELEPDKESPDISVTTNDQPED